jgi:hypothetical protein
LDETANRGEDSELKNELMGMAGNRGRMSLPTAGRHEDEGPGVMGAAHRRSRRLGASQAPISGRYGGQAPEVTPGRESDFHQALLDAAAHDDRAYDTVSQLKMNDLTAAQQHQYVQIRRDREGNPWDLHRNLEGEVGSSWPEEVREAARPRQVSDAPVDTEEAAAETEAAEEASPPSTARRSGPTAKSDKEDLKARKAQHARGEGDPGKRAGTTVAPELEGGGATVDPRKGAWWKERESKRKERAKEKRQPKTREEKVADVVAQKKRGKLPTPSEKRTAEEEAGRGGREEEAAAVAAGQPGTTAAQRAEQEATKKKAAEEKKIEEALINRILARLQEKLNNG